MKRIPISNKHFLHVYLVEEKNVGDDFLESIYESESEDIEIEQGTVPYEDPYEVGARDFKAVLKDRYCRAFLMSLADEMVRSVIEDCQRYCPQLLETEEYKKFVEYHKADNGALA